MPSLASLETDSSSHTRISSTHTNRSVIRISYLSCNQGPNAHLLESPFKRPHRMKNKHSIPQILFSLLRPLRLSKQKFKAQLPKMSCLSNLEVWNTHLGSERYTYNIHVKNRQGRIKHMKMGPRHFHQVETSCMSQSLFWLSTHENIHGKVPKCC